MIWALLIFIFAVLLQGGAGYVVGDIVSHAFSYDLTRGTAIWEGLLVVVLLLLKSWLEYRFAPEKKSRAAFAVPESAIWFVGTILLAVILELYTDLGIPMQPVIMLLVTICSLVYERDTYLQFFRETLESSDENVTPDGEDEYAFAADRKEEQVSEVKKTIIAEDDEIQVEVIEDAPTNARVEETAPIEDIQTVTEKEETAGDTNKDTESDTTAEDESDSEADGESEEIHTTGGISTAQTVFYITARVLAALAAVVIGIMAFLVLKDSENRFQFYVFMVLGAVVTVILRLLPGEPGGMVNDDKETLPDADMEANRNALVRKRVVYGVTAGLITVFLCIWSVLVGLIFLLDAFLIGVLIPMGTYRYAVGGTEAVARKTDLLSRITTRVLLTVMIIISAWQLGYGALWEYQFLMILGATFAGQEALIRYNHYLV